MDAASGDTITLTGLSGVITLTSGQLSISKDLAIEGPGSTALSIDGNASSRIFSISGATVSISGLTITNGNNSGIYNNDGILTLTNSAVSGNTANQGAGIYNNVGTVIVTDSIVSGNTANNGGGGIFSPTAP